MSEEQSTAAGADNFKPSMERLADSFEHSARRWELIAYPSIIAFIILAAYGFYLIYHLAHDVARLSQDLSKITHTMERNMSSMALNMEQVSDEMTRISSQVEQMNRSVAQLEPMLDEAEEMNRSVRAMAISSSLIQRDMGALNHNVSVPMSAMQSMNPMVPWVGYRPQHYYPPLPIYSYPAVSSSQDKARL